MVTGRNLPGTVWNNALREHAAGRVRLDCDAGKLAIQ
jgi:hypothetical protein